ncbi:MAG: hypothetical protein ABL998_08545 [Planctomycetota bacterium]
MRSLASLTLALFRRYLAALRMGSRSASPLPATLGLTALASFGAGTATLGIFFVTEEAYRFSPAQQYAFGLLVGLTYTLAALGASRARRFAARRGLDARAFLALLSFGMAALMCVPLVTSSAAALYAVIALYSPLTGLFWPLVEGYVSGGRRGGALRSAIGRFNLTWSSTLVVSFLAVPPLLGVSSARVFAAIVVAHLASTLFLLGLAREPAEHEDDEAHAVPANYPQLLAVHRVLHAVSYLVMYALTPYLPELLTSIGVPKLEQGLVAATWLAVRVVAFFVLERWHGWHGRGSFAVMSIAATLLGFALAVLAPQWGDAARSALIAGLALFGAGLAGLYTAALYYVFEVGGSDGGGSHEALIGLGYSIGPSCGLAVCALEGAGVIGATQRDGVLLAVVSALALGGAWLGWRRRGLPG